MLEWKDVQFYRDKFFRTSIDLYFCDGVKLVEHQPWKPWSKYILIPARSHLHITKVEKVRIPTYMGLGQDIKGVVVMGTLPPWVLQPIDVTNIIEKAQNRDVLKMDRKLSYSHSARGQPWQTPTLRPTYLDVLR